MKRAPALAALLLAAFPSAVYADTYDVVIKGGRVIDPASGRDEIADVGINGRSVAAISSSPLQGKKTLDAKGMVVSPGFIDLHAHGQNPKGEYYQLLDGVTTSMDMEIGTMPITDFFASLQGKAYINFGASAAHICARIEVMTSSHCLGEGTRSDDATRSSIPYTAPATEEQEARIVAAMNREIAKGALGYGLGIEYVPGVGRREIYKVFQAAAISHAPVFTHVRSRPKDRAPGVPIAVAQEVIADAVSTGASLQLVHVTSTGLTDAPTIIDMIKGARAHGADITTEAYPYTAGSTGIGSEFFSDGWQQRNGISYGDIQWPATGERLTEESFNRYRKEFPDRTVVIHVIPEAVVEVAMADPIVSIASDGVPWVTGGEHPRGAGTFSRVLGMYVREKHVLDLKTALTKMTIMPARRLETVSPQMAKKGRIQIGSDADITVFDPAKIKDMATYEKPMQPSVGIHYVLVGGQVMVTDGKVTPNLFPGIAIRSGKSQ